MSYLQADGELSGKELGDVVRGGVGAVNDLDSQQLLVTESLGDTNLGVAALEKKKKKRKKKRKKNHFLQIFDVFTS